MGLEVKKYSVYQADANALKKNQDDYLAKLSQKKEEGKVSLQKDLNRKQISKQQTEKYLKELLHLTSIFDRELRFSVNRKLNQVVVKVIDSHTDKVIKEIPPEDIIRLHTNMKEVIGLLFDKEI